MEEGRGLAALIDLLGRDVVKRNDEAGIAAAGSVLQLAEARACRRLALQTGDDLRVDPQIEAHVRTAPVWSRLRNLKARLGECHDGGGVAKPLFVDQIAKRVLLVEYHFVQVALQRVDQPSVFVLHCSNKEGHVFAAHRLV